MKSIYCNNNLYSNRKLKIDNLQLSINRLKAEIKWIEDEISRIRDIDNILCSKVKIDGVKKRSVYRADNTITLDSLTYQKVPSRMLLNWNDAVNYASRVKTSGYEDWRLPTIDELEKLFIKNSKMNSYGDRYFIDKYFLNSMPKDAKFWSSSEENEHYAWVVDFNLGYDYWRHKRGRYYALYVRDIKE